MRRVLAGIGGFFKKIWLPPYQWVRRHVAVGPLRPLGWFALLTAVVLAGIGAWAGWIELMVPAAALLGALLCATLLAAGRSAFGAELTMADRRVRVGERAMGQLAVWNSSRRRLLPARMVLPVGPAEIVFQIGSLAPGQRFDEVFTVPTAKRALLRVGPVRSSRGDPLGLIDRAVKWTDAIDLYVHPRIVPLKGTTAGILRDLEGQPTEQITDSDISFHALREYVPGDDRRNIHWKSSARLGKLMVRQYQESRRVHVGLALSTAASEYADPEDFELAISVLASIGVQNLRDERETSALAGRTLLRTERARALMDDCCPLEMAPDGLGALRMARSVVRDVPGTSLMYLLTGGVLSHRDVRGAVTHLPPDLRIVTVRCATGQEAEFHQTGRLTQLTVGQLEDLPRLLRQAVPV